MQMPSIPEPDQPLAAEGVAVRLAAERDIPEILIAHQDDPRLHERLGLARPPSGAELGRQLEQAARQRQSGSGVTFTILQPGSEECAGQIEVYAIDWEARRAAARAWVAPQLRGRGLEEAALALVARWLSARCGLELTDG
jgi:RimJ/RimL family protein N-acetyltransferase